MHRSWMSCGVAVRTEPAFMRFDLLAESDSAIALQKRGFMSSNTINSRDRVPISELKTLHRAVRDVESQLDCPPFPGVDSRPLNPKFLKSYIELNPLPVRQTRTGFVCLGSIGILSAAKHILDPGVEIPVREISRRINNNVLAEAYLAERFYLPAIFGLQVEDLRRLWQVARRIEAVGIHHDLGLGTKTAFARMYAIDSRRLAAR